MKKNIIKSLNDINNLSKLIHINKIVISGGGMRGLGFIGALKYLEELNILKNINDYYGCSIGSVICLLLYLNYSIDEIINFSINFDFSIIVNNFDNLVKNYSIGNSNNYITVLKSFLINKKYDSEITLRELHDINKKKLNLVVFNISKKKEELFNYINNPDLKVWEAVYMTCSLPFLFEPYFYNNNYYCDGGIFNNNPINLIPQELQINTLCIGTKIYNPEDNLTLLLKNRTFINLCKYMFEILYITFTRGRYDMYNNIIWIDSYSGSDVVNFNINKEQKIISIKKGYNICKNKLVNIIIDILNYNKKNILL